MKNRLNGLHCIMYVYNRTYIFSRLILKETGLPEDVVDIIFKNILRVDIYVRNLQHLPNGVTGKNGQYCNAFYKYGHCLIRMKPAFKIKEPRVGHNALLIFTFFHIMNII